MAHPIQTFLSGKAKSQASLARDLGVGRAHISEIVAGRSRMSMKLAMRIVKLTGGEISLADIGNWEPPRRKRKAVRAKR
jgi:DNA-binding transcriptional regulator YdaS (Cro superfamily)